MRRGKVKQIQKELLRCHPEGKARRILSCMESSRDVAIVNKEVKIWKHTSKFSSVPKQARHRWAPCLRQGAKYANTYDRNGFGYRR